MTRTNVGIALVIIALAPQAYSTFLPSFHEVRTTRDTVEKSDIREGEIFASTLILLGSIAGSIFTDSVAPIIMGLIVIGVMVSIYEYALSGSDVIGDMIEGNE